MSKVEIKIMRLPHCNDLPLPTYQTIGAAGFDLQAALVNEIILMPSEIKLIPTGFAMQLPQNYEGQVRPRSGLASKHGITLPNSPGTVDSDYRGEIKVPLINLGTEPFTISHSMRIAQMIVAPVSHAFFTEVTSLEKSQRNEKGFGSTGVLPN